MANVKALECPKCGGPLDVEEEQRLTLCLHCGSRVRITYDGSGPARAELSEQVTTAVVEQAFLRDLTRRRKLLLREREGLEASAKKLRNREKRETTSQGFGLGCGCLTVIVGGFLFFLSPAIFGMMLKGEGLPSSAIYYGLAGGAILMVIGAVSMKRDIQNSQRGREGVRLKYDPEAFRLERELQAIEGRIANVDDGIEETRANIVRIDEQLVRGSGKSS